MVVGLTFVIYQIVPKPVDRKIILPRVLTLPPLSSTHDSVRNCCSLTGYNHGHDVP